MRVSYVTAERVLADQLPEDPSDFNFAFVFYPCGLEEKALFLGKRLQSMGLDYMAVSGGGVLISRFPYIFDTQIAVVLVNFPEDHVKVLADSFSIPEGFCGNSAAILFTDERTDMEYAASKVKERGVDPVLGGVAGSYIGEWVSRIPEVNIAESGLDKLPFSKEPKIFYNGDRVSTFLLLFNTGSFLVKGKSVLGWEPIKIYGEVTKAEGRFIYSIDDVPAAEYLMRFVGDSLDEYIKHFMVAFAVYVDGEDYVLASIKSVNEREGYVETFHSVIDVGTKVAIAIPCSIDKIIKEEEKALTGYPLRDFSEDERLLLCVACIGRRTYISEVYPMVFLGMANSRVKFSGFFSNGEYNFTSSGKSCTFLNLTFSTIFVAERK